MSIPNVAIEELHLARFRMLLRAARRAPGRATPIVLSLCALAVSAGGVRAQEPTGLTNPPPALQGGEGARLRQQLLGSGRTPDQLRQQLASRGYDPSILDPYLDPDIPAPPTPGADVLAALRALNIRPAADTTAPAPTPKPAPDTAAPPPRRTDLLMPDSLPMEREYGVRVFGLRTFAREGNEFEPLSMGPVPPDYRVGPGDELVVILTGDVERSYTLPVSREGLVVIPQVGQVWVNGLTLADLRERLRSALARSYSGITAEPQPTAHVEVALGRLRSNQLFLTGEVMRPGSYMGSPVASVLNALYLAGGPRPEGSFRSVRVMRGGKLVGQVDLYGYLTRGEDVSRAVLQPGDVIFVPVHGPQVAVKGEVVRPALYELIPGETLLDVLQFAGGLTAPAATGRATVTRILPPSQRTQPGIDRTVVEVDLAAVLGGKAPAPVLEDGDELRIFRVRSEVRNVVTVAGAVWKDCAPRLPAEPPDTAPPTAPSARPDSAGFPPVMPDSATRQLCTVAFRPGMRAWDAIEAVEGLRPDAYRPRGQIVRLDPSDSTLHVVPFSLATRDGVPVENPQLEEHDAIRVFSRTDFRDSLAVQITGEVRRGPRLQVPYHEGMTLADLVLQAGGLTPDADLTVEISRRPDPAERAAGKLAETVTVQLGPSAIVSEPAIRAHGGAQPGAETGALRSADTVRLEPHDHVFVRRMANLEPERTVSLQGEVRYPGSYALRSKDERLSELVQRAGGLTRTAFPRGFQLYRDSSLVNVDLEEALEHPGSPADLIILPGDSMNVAEYNPVVVVQGAVNSPASVLYREGAGLDYYVSSAGGYARHADRDNVYVRYANGQGSVRERILVFKRRPVPAPGSTVTVPLVPEDDRPDVRGLVGDVIQIATSVGTLLLLISRL